MKRFWKRLGLALLGFFILINIIFFIQAYSSSHFNPAPRSKPAKQGLGSILLHGVRLYKKPIDAKPSTLYQTVWLTNEEGQKLEGWYVPAKNSKGTVLLFHGHGSNKAKVLCEAEYFHSLGYNTFSLDLRAHGNSQGTASSIGYYETRDIKAAYDFLKKKNEQNIVLWGISMGAASILKAVPEFNLKPSKIIVECPFARMQDGVSGFLRKMKIPETGVAEMMTFYGSIQQGMWGFSYQPQEYAKQIAQPVLLQWGRHDDRVLQQETESIFQNLATKNKQLTIYENSGHQSYCQKESAKWQMTVAAFLKR